MLKTGILTALAFAVLSAASALAADETSPSVYAAIADRVDSGEISCAAPDLSDLAVGLCEESGKSDRFSGMLRFRWQFADNARNTGLAPWVRAELNYHAEVWDNVHLNLGLGGDTEYDGMFWGAPPVD